MLKARPFYNKRQRGTTLLEVLVTIIILAFGLLGLAGLQAKVQSAELESYQRVQAILLLSEMSERISANRSQAASYVSANTLGAGDVSASAHCPSVSNGLCVCTGLATGTDRDLCEWSNDLKGAGEQKSATSLGAMLGARGCITQGQAPDPTANFCTPGIYLVSVAWQGFNPTTASAYTCGQGLYGTDTYRRVISTQLTVGLPNC